MDVLPGDLLPVAVDHRRLHAAREPAGVLNSPGSWTSYLRIEERELEAGGRNEGPQSALADVEDEAGGLHRELGYLPG
jgi:hypothetical protein